MWQKLSASLVLCFFVIIQPLQAIAQQTPPTPNPQQPQGYYWPGPWNMWGDGFGWQFWWICPLMMLFMIVIFATIFFFVRRSSGDGLHYWGPAWRHPDHTALQILSERFARGEIKKDEYEEKKATILSGGQR
jgi:uncharacterized membrane protein